MTFESRNIRNLSAQKNSRFRLVSRRPGDHEGNDGDVAILGRGAFGGGVTLLVKSYGKWYGFESGESKAANTPVSTVIQTDPGEAILPLLPTQWHLDNESAPHEMAKSYVVDVANNTATSYDHGFGVSLGKNEDDSYSDDGLCCDVLIPQGWEAYAIKVHSSTSSTSDTPISGSTLSNIDMYVWKVTMSSLGYGENLNAGYSRLSTNSLEALVPTMCNQDQYIHVSCELGKYEGSALTGPPRMIHGGFIKIRKL